MKNLRLVTVIIFTIIACSSAMAAFTGSADDRNKDKYSLKNLNKFSKNYSLNSLHNNAAPLRGFYMLNQTDGNNRLQTNSFISLQRGTTTYVYPYKYKVRVPKFKTPVPPQQ